MVEVESYDGKYGYARYDQFELGNEKEQFALKELGKYSGTAGDAMEYLKGKKFTTKDRDHDSSSGNCAYRLKGAWWYWNCAASNLNGPYVKGERMIEGYYPSNNWYYLNENYEGLKITRMMVKEA